HSSLSPDPSTTATSTLSLHDALPISLTGRATTLFRPPYAADTQPARLAELTPLKIAQDQNYLVVLENIDPQDWARPGADVILQRDRKSTRLNSSHLVISYAVFCLKKK